MISVDNVTIRFGDFVLFDSISFQLNKGDRVGLVGRNGAGKTTLLNLISRKQTADEGKVVVSGDTAIGYLPQQMKHSGDLSLRDETMKAFEHVLSLQEEINRLNKSMEERTDY